MKIPEEIFEDPNPLWKSFVVGYFIGDAPHVGPIHATVNRIWSSPRAGSKIDVQFIEKKTVLFRIENPQMRARVIQRKYWHVADVPLVVHEWSPETAMNPPDLSALPMWVDLQGVPNQMFSHKGLKCLARAVGIFVKLHPNTEKCIRLDVARLLVEVDFQKPLVEKITFVDKLGTTVELGVSYPWLPPKCDVCRKWGHKGTECSAKNIIILEKDKGSDLPPVVVAGEQESTKNPVSDLLQELEEFTPYAPLGNVVEVNDMLRSIVLGAGTVETGQSGEVLALEKVGMKVSEGSMGAADRWTEVTGHSNESTLEAVGSNERDGILVSPSRFQALADITEEEEAEPGDISETEEAEEGEIVADTMALMAQDTSKRNRKSSGVAQKGSKLGTHTAKPAKRTFARSKDLQLEQIRSSSKKTSVRKL